MQSVLEYDSPLPIYALDWCKTSGNGSYAHLPRSSYRLALGSLADDFRNRISIIGLPDERSLQNEDPYAPSDDASNFVLLADALHGYPVTKIGWEPAAAAQDQWRGSNTELLITTGDALRVWEYTESEDMKSSGYIGRRNSTLPAKLQQRVALSSTKNPNPITAPLTSFSWNIVSPRLVVTSSIDTTCTVWDLSTHSAVTQLIAHDREVYDVAWIPKSVDSFVSVGADGSLRAFDLRSLEHSTILYETPNAPAPKAAASSAPAPSAAATGARSPQAALLRIAFHPTDSNYLATFHSDSPDVEILDMRSPGRPVVELRGHRAPITSIGWGSGLATSTPDGTGGGNAKIVATAGDDCQVLVWDLSSGNLIPPSSSSSSNGSSSSGGVQPPPRSPHPDSGPNAPLKTTSDPMLAYTSVGEVNNLAWSPPLPGAYGTGGASGGSARDRQDPKGGLNEWVAFASGKTVKALRI